MRRFGKTPLLLGKYCCPSGKKHGFPKQTELFWENCVSHSRTVFLLPKKCFLMPSSDFWNNTVCEGKLVSGGLTSYSKTKP